MTNENKVRVWDIAVRLFHWSLVILFAVTYLTGEELPVTHAYAGYAIIGLLAFRILWGFIGGKYARFGNFLYGPKAVVGYLKGLFSDKAEHYLGHNPAGGWMIIALLISLTATCWSGLEAYAVEGHGPLVGGAPAVISAAHADGHGYRDDDDDERGEGGEGGEKNEFWEELHEGFANFTLFLIFLHVLGVVVSSRLHDENLVRAMIDGYKKARHQD